jgi:hypothetical protein
MRTVERARARKELAREAGLGSISAVSVLAGVLVAYGAIALLTAALAGIAGAFDVADRDLSPSDWQDAGVGAAIALGVILFVSFFFGGYVAGRMGRRAGLAHGVAVFVLGLLIALGIAAAAAGAADGDAITDELRSRGIPTSADDWQDLGLWSGLGLVAATLVGSILGGGKGERWHGLLVTRALDPTVGPTAERERTIDLSAAEQREAARRDADRAAGDQQGTGTTGSRSGRVDDGHEHKV